jgi:tryptophan-rich sensory protein
MGLFLLQGHSAAGPGLDPRRNTPIFEFMTESAMNKARPVVGDRRRAVLGLAAFVALAAIASAIGSSVTLPQIDGWYVGLAKPSFTPPNWVFGPVWTLIYLTMAIAGWLIWYRYGLSEARVALSLFAVQLVLNVLWSVLFFGLQRPGIALVDIVLLWLAILATLAAFLRLRPAAGWLLVPYLLWVSYAVALNAAIVQLNP